MRTGIIVNFILRIFINRSKHQHIFWKMLLRKCRKNSCEGVPSKKKLKTEINFRGALMQIWKSANTFIFIWKQYVEDFTLKHLLLFEICTHEICEKFVYKHSETIEYVKNLPTFWEINKLHGQITWEFLGLRMQNFQSIVFIWTNI